MRVREMEPQDRPREKLLQKGAKALSNAELLALLLRTGNPGEDVLELAARLLADTGSLNTLARMEAQEIIAVAKGIGPAKACELAAVFELGRRGVEEAYETARIDSPEAVHGLLAHEMSALRQESLRVVLLNTRHRLMRLVNVSIGSVNESIADPREIFRPAVIHNAFAMILVHNHPSGDPSPSESDRRLTTRVRECADLLRVRLLDHVIIGRPAPDHPPYFSFKEHGLL
jgi:DNA repair protein RadC